MNFECVEQQLWGLFYIKKLSFLVDILKNLLVFSLKFNNLESSKASDVSFMYVFCPQFSLFPDMKEKKWKIDFFYSQLSVQRLSQGQLFDDNPTHFSKRIWSHP